MAPAPPPSMKIMLQFPWVVSRSSFILVKIQESHTQDMTTRNMMRNSGYYNHRHSGCFNYIILIILIFHLLKMSMINVVGS